jgi:aminopeptidase N
MDSRIKPINYNLSLFDLQFGGKWGYTGLVRIDSKITELTEEIVINTKELEIHSAEVFGGDGKCMYKPWTRLSDISLIGMMLISVQHL